MFAKCRGPIWRQDDLSQCFEVNFLETIFPLTALAISLAYILLWSGWRNYIPRNEKSQLLPDSEDHQQNDGTYKDDPDDAENTICQNANGNGALSHVTTQKSLVQADKPRGQFSIVTLELVLIIAELAIHVIDVINTQDSRRIKTAAAVGFSYWAYLFVIAISRLVFTRTATSWYPNLWYQTALLYSIQWLFVAFLFRSSLIHSHSRLATNLTIADFSICSVLTLIALTSRIGNRTITLILENDLEPSREPLANAWSFATFGWVDSIIWRGYWKPLDLPDVWNLEAKDKSAKVLAEFRNLKQAHTLAWQLLRFFKRELIIQVLWSIISGVFTFAPTLLMKAFLEYVENPQATPVNAAWLYITLLALTTCVRAVSDGQALWVGRKISIRLRAVIIGEVYAKALRRRAGAGTDAGEKKEKDSDTPKADQKSPKTKSATTAYKARKPRRSSFVAQSNPIEQVENAEAEPRPKTTSAASQDGQANNGKIINLMSVDSFKVSEISAYLHFLWGTTPVQLIMCVALLYRILGWSSIAAIIMMVLVLPLNLFIARQFTKKQKKVMAGTDTRISSTNEILQNIRIIKYFAWEQYFGQRVTRTRTMELRALRNKYILWAFAATVWFSLPIMITFFSFFLYTIVEERPLVPSVAFSALSLFTILRYPLDQLADMIAHVQESKVSIDRVQEFLNEEDTAKYDQQEQGAEKAAGENIIGLDAATLTWGAHDGGDKKGHSAFRLINMDVRFKLGSLNIIAGPTGSGKTSLLMALLGEMTLVKGTLHLPGCRSREDSKPDPDTGLTESIAYCAQQAWLVNDTVKENILFSSPYDRSRYRAVLAACALESDLKILDEGDLTLVGEKGIALSGGQKQRISLARALYSSSKHLLLDDCLSAVDSHTAKHIFEDCMMGPLMFGRTCILVTHNIALCVPLSRYVVVLDNGKIVSKGTPSEVIASGAFGDEALKSRPGSRRLSTLPSRAPSNEALNEDSKVNGDTKQNGHISTLSGKDPEEVEIKSKANTRTETKVTGSVNFRVVAMYLSSMGPWYYWLFAFSMFALQQVGSVSCNVLIRTWSNSYTRRAEILIKASNRPVYSFLTGSGHTPSSFSPSSLYWSLPVSAIPNAATFASTLQDFQDVDDRYYLFVYAMLGVFYVLVSFTKEGYIFWGSLRASKSLHRRLLDGITRAKLQFFDTTPLGQLMNRFSKDIEAIDQDVSPVAVGVLSCFASLISMIVLISVITPGFLIAGVFIFLIYYTIGAFYLRSSRDLKRLESVQRSPIYQQFGETLSGAVTIRAYGDERRFIRDNQVRVDTHNRPFIYLWATNRWLSLRVDFAGALVSFFAGAFILIGIKRTDAGSAGLSLTYAVTFTENVLWLVRLYSLNEQNMNSVERVKEYIEIEQEAAAIVEDNRPPIGWPSKGGVEFIKYSTRYRADLDPVLRDLSFSIRPGERMAIVGRTGAGKSSLALALFRALEAESGRILIDGIDIGQIGLQDLRENITIVPQDPTLFTGTIRSNLDPFTLFTDEEVFDALRRVQLIGPTAAVTPSPKVIPPTVHPDTDTQDAYNVISPLSSRQTEAAPDEPAEAASSTLTLTKTPTNTPEAGSNTNAFLDLSHPISESGSNLSQGQRQLLCLARALLKKPRVLVMDEATASIDYATDARIQDTLRESTGSGMNGGDTTVITIAHRLQTIVDYDNVLVLDKGRVVEYGAPWDLLSGDKKPKTSKTPVQGEGFDVNASDSSADNGGAKTGWFRDMCEMSGETEALTRAAMEAGRKKRAREQLVDVDDDQVQRPWI